jgi:hypothetical protein
VKPNPARTLIEAMAQLGREAEENGMTPEILESILQDGRDEAIIPSATLEELLVKITTQRDRPTGEAKGDPQ